jgi:hypothetical protein
MVTRSSRVEASLADAVDLMSPVREGTGLSARGTPVAAVLVRRRSRLCLVAGGSR